MNTPLMALEQLGDRDVRFIAEAVVSAPGQRRRVESLARAEPRALEAMLGDRRLVDRILNDDKALFSISPYLFFTVLLRQVRVDYEKSPGAVPTPGDRSAGHRSEAAGLLADAGLIHYLAQMLASFTRPRRLPLAVEGAHNIAEWDFNDLDMAALIRLGVMLPHAERMAIFRRVGDLALLLTGVFPDYVAHRSFRTRALRLPRRSDDGHGGRTASGRRTILGPSDQLEDIGRRYYRRAARHPRAEWLGWDELCRLLSQRFSLLRDSLNYLSRQYIEETRFVWFPGAKFSDGGND